MQSILLLFHCESNTGYAIGPLEATFYQMALALCGGNEKRIHVGYSSMRRGRSEALPAAFDQYIVLDAANATETDCVRAQEYIRANGIDTLFAFDQPTTRRIYKYFRRGGIEHFVSYWGAPMSSLNSGLKLALKRLEVSFHRYGPDLYIFESQGMANTAIFGRGVSSAKTRVIHLGVDGQKFRPCEDDASYIYDQLSIPKGRRVFFYSGHFEERKGVAVIMRAANRLARMRKIDDWHICLFGNKDGGEKPYEAMLSQEAARHVTFGGYRKDLDRLQGGCYAAIIASTGWDSFPRSALEMQASGLPLLASDLEGLRESVAVGESGYLFVRDNDEQLCGHMEALLDNRQLRGRLSLGARRRIETDFTLEIQLRRLIETMAEIVKPVDLVEVDA